MQKIITKPSCEWCAGSEDDAERPGDLCRPHLAEYEGLSLDGLDHMEREQALDQL